VSPSETDSSMTKSGILTLLFLLLASWSMAQTVTSFDGIAASQVGHPEYDVDPNGAVGTKQYMEWINVYYQAYDKVTLAPVWSTPQAATTPFTAAGLSACNNFSGDGIISFDRLASRWVISVRTTLSNNYTHCIAVSNTDDLTSSSLRWYAYAIPLNPILGTNAEGNVYFPDWPKLGTWPDAYYLTIDLNDVNNNYREVGVVVCALDRTNMLNGGTPNAPQCFRETSPLSNGIYLGHSLIPADVDGTTAPPSGRDEYLVSIENPVDDGVTKTSSSFNLWQFHVDWATPANSTFTQSSVSVAPYTPGCYSAASPSQTVCVPEPSTATTGQHIDSVGDRFMPRFDYRNFGSYESFLISHTVQTGTGSSQQTGVRWYELRGSGTPMVYQDGTVSPDTSLYRFMPSIAQDSSGNAAVGYSVSSASVHPGINAAWWNLTNLTAPVEFSILTGTADEENTYHWGDYSSMTVDPVNGCTFWYVNEYFPQNETGTQITWHTRIANFSLPGCGGVSVSPTSLTFASQAVGTTSAAQAVTLTNNLSTTLTITNIGFTGTNSGDFSQTNTCGGSVPAGGNCTINVSFTPGASGARSATLNVTDDADNSPQTVSLSGTGVVPVTLSTTSISFGTVLVGSSATASPVTLTNNLPVSLTNINISVTGAAFSQMNTCGTSIGPGAQCTITVTFAPKTSGTQTGTVTISDSASNSPQSISLKGAGMLPVTLTPTTLAFGTQTVGTTSAPKTETVSNNQKVTLTITSISITGANASDFAETGTTCGSTLSAGAKCTVTLTFTPSAKGARNATLKLTDSAATSPQTAKLSGTGQ
jgi:centrosomal CEP192-like protein/ASPM-SPD-2-Hydin domain-containing protein